MLVRPHGTAASPLRRARSRSAAFARILAIAALGLLASSPSFAAGESKERIAAFFQGWIRWIPDSKVEIGLPLNPASELKVLPVLRHSSNEKYEDRLATLWDERRDEIFLGEVLYSAEALNEEREFDPDRDLPAIRAHIAEQVRSEIGLRRDAAIDRPGLVGYRLVIKTPIGPYGRQLYASTDRTLLLVGEFVAIDTDPKEMRRKRLAARPGFSRKSAPLAIHEFADLECPLCRKRDGELEQLLKANPRLGATVEVHQFPLSSDHKWSAVAASRAACLGEASSNAFFEFQSLMYSNQELMDVERVEATARDLAEKLELAAPLAKCIEGRAGDFRVIKDLELGSSLGVRTTPSFVIDGILVSGEIDLVEKLLRKLTPDKFSLPPGSERKKTKQSGK